MPVIFLAITLMRVHVFGYIYHNYVSLIRALSVYLSGLAETLCLRDQSGSNNGIITEFSPGGAWGGSGNHGLPRFAHTPGAGCLMSFMALKNLIFLRFCGLFGRRLHVGKKRSENSMELINTEFERSLEE